MTWNPDEFTDLFENAPIGIHWVGPDGIVLHVNRAELELMGYTREEYVGRHIAEFHVDRAVIDDLLRQLSRGEDIHGCEVRLRTKDGSVRHVIIDSNVRWDGDRFVHTRCFTRDVTERTRVRSEAARRRREAEILADLARSINASLDLDAILQTVAEGARELCDSDLSAIALRDQTGAMTFRHRSGVRLVATRDDLTILPGRGAGGLALTSGQSVRSDSLAEDSRFTYDTTYLRAAAAEGIVTVMVVPIRIAEVVEGLLYVDNRAPRPFTDRDEDVLRDLADHAAIAIQNVHLLEREQRARAEAEAANRMKDEFLATLSHELRTPLNAVLGWTVMLRAGSLDGAATARALDVIERNTRAQTQLIEDLLDVSRIVTGKVRLDVRVLDPIPVIEAALDSIRPAAEAKGLRLQTILDPRAGPISGDPDRLQQVVWNLLSNAIKFTSRGGRVHVRLQRVNSHVEIVVSDSGQGIEPDLLPHVFDRFRQADSTTTRAKGGLGIGLAIAKQLVELHGGTVRVESPGPGQGATFVVALPLLVRVEDTADRVHPTARRGATTATASLAGVRVLVVDDQRDALDLLESLLVRGEADVHRAETVTGALDALATWRPDVIVSDIDMPGEDGYQLIRKIRARAASDGGRIPAVAVTAYGSVEDRIRILSAGFQIHVAKPVEPAELIAIIASLTGRLAFTSDPHAKGHA